MYIWLLFKILVIKGNALTLDYKVYTVISYVIFIWEQSNCCPSAYDLKQQFKTLSPAPTGNCWPDLWRKKEQVNSFCKYVNINPFQF